MITRSEYLKAKKIVEDYKNQKLESKAKILNKSRYFVDIRNGCAAIRDRLHESYDEEYPGLHQSTEDVVENKHGYISKNSWVLREEDIQYLHDKCKKLNESI